MRFAILAVVVFTGCGGGREYRQVVAPVPSGPIMPPHSGPMVGPLPPGRTAQQKPTLPPSPNKSVKPAKSEPTLYAADEVRASGKFYPYEVGNPYVHFKGMPTSLTDECVAEMTIALQRAHPGLASRDVDSYVSVCLDARLIGFCVEQRVKGRTDDIATKVREQARKHAKDGCNRNTNTSEVERLVRAVAALYE